MNLSRFLFFFASLALVLSACVTNKKYVLLQKNDLYKSVPIDSVVRDHQTVPFDYKVQPEDILSVQFESLTPKDFDFLNQNQAGPGSSSNAYQGNALLIGELVDRNGEILLPFLGKVKVGGLTIFEIQDHLQAIARPYLDTPVVKVRLVNFRFTILGEVNREGTITVSNNRVSLLEALGLAGGMTDLADRHKIKLIRHVNGHSDVQYINLLDENFLTSPYYYIHQNDVLIVSSLRQRPYRKYFSQNFSLVLSTLSLLLLSVNLFFIYNNN